MVPAAKGPSMPAPFRFPRTASVTNSKISPKNKMMPKIDCCGVVSVTVLLGTIGSETMFSPRHTCITARAPLRTAPSTSFARKRGSMTESTIPPAVTSVSSPSTPLPTSMRKVRSFNAIKIRTPLSFCLSPMPHVRARSME